MGHLSAAIQYCENFEFLLVQHVPGRWKNSEADLWGSPTTGYHFLIGPQAVQMMVD